MRNNILAQVLDQAARARCKYLLFDLYDHSICKRQFGENRIQ